MSTLKDLSCLINSRLTVDDLNKKVEYLIANFLVKQSLNLFFAKGGMGKSYISLAIAIYLLKEKKINECIYLDMDNSAVALKSRNLDKIIQENENLIYAHRSKVDKNPLSILTELLKESKKESNKFENSLIILDSIRDFLENKDMTTDKDIIPIMNMLKSLRDNGATIIILHHTTKDSKTTQYKGSTSFRDSPDIAYAISSERKDNTLTYQLKVDKDRISVEDVAFVLNTQTMELKSEIFLKTDIPEYEYDFIEQVQLLISRSYDDLNQSDLIKELNSKLSERTVRKYLKKYSNEYWNITKNIKKNNASYYSLKNPLPTLSKLLRS